MENDPHHNPDTIDLPTPTGWPIVAAFGLTLVFTGLVTDLFVSVIGFLTGVIGAAGWFSDVFPHSLHVATPVVPEAERAKPIRTHGRVVQMLVTKDSVLPNRAHVPMEVHPYNAGVWGGIAGGIVMAVMACAFGLFYYHSIWYPINLLAAAGIPSLSEMSLADLHNFNLAGLIVGIIAHGSISILIGLLYAIMIPMFPRRQEWIWGGIVTPLIWTGLVWATLRLINPMLDQGVNWPWFIICQIAFGLVCGLVVFKSGKIETMQSWSLAQKLGVEHMHRDEEIK